MIAFVSLSVYDPAARVSAYAGLVLQTPARLVSNEEKRALVNQINLLTVKGLATQDPITEKNIFVLQIRLRHRIVLPISLQALQMVLLQQDMKLPFFAADWPPWSKPF